MNPIKSLHINTERTWRGGEQQVLYLARVLKVMDSNPVVICQKSGELRNRLKAEGIEWHELNMRGEFDIISAIKISNFINKGGFDVVHAHTSHAHSLMAIASIFLKKKAKLVVSRRVDFPLKRGFLNKLKYKLPDKYIAVSNAIKEVMIDCGIPAEKVAIVHSGVDPNKFRGSSKSNLLKEFGLSGKEKIIGNIAHLADHKGQSYLIDAFAKLVKTQSDDLRLFIVGEGKLEEALRKQATSLGINNKVVFTGFREDIGNFYDLFDIFVISSILEGLCTSILDALITKTPVVATDAGGIPEIIQDKFNGRLVKKKDSTALANAIKEMLNDSDEAYIYTENGYKFVIDNFDYHITAEKTCDIYKELLM